MKKQFSTSQSSFDLSTVEDTGWRPEAPPVLDRYDDLELDFETTGLRWWDTDLPIGAAVRYPDGTRKYYPWGHRGGGNLDEGVVKRWFLEQWKHKTITNFNTRFEVHMAHAWGIDFEAQGCHVSDVGHYVALLDDHRDENRLDLGSIAEDYLGYGKTGENLDKSRMASYHAGQVANYACQDVHLVGELKKVLWPKLDAENLQAVRQLEDELIYVVCEMERNGAPIDVELLHRWIKDCEQVYLRCLWELETDLGIGQFNPNSNEDWHRLYQKRGIPATERTPPSKKFPEGQLSFTDEVLKHVPDEYVQLARKAKKLDTLQNNYLLKMDRCRTGNIIRYALHQLRAQKDEWAERGEAGTVSGRFSSTALIRDEVGVNQQQVMKAPKQRVAFGYDEDDNSHDDELFLVRQLYIPGSGLFLSADAMQIEYRLFAHHAGSKRILDAYADNPELSFHKFMHGIFKPLIGPDFTYRRQKDVNFAEIYAAGIKKVGWMTGFLTKSQFEMLRDTNASNDHPLLAPVLRIKEIYNREIPEAKLLRERASHLAATECDKYCNKRKHQLYGEHRGYVQTQLGRRMRFPDNQRLHKALNGVIQGTAADIMKLKLIELHKQRKATGFTLRFTVHDEVDGDVPDLEAKVKVKAILNQQSFPELRVPILWGVSTGRNWKEC